MLTEAQIATGGTADDPDGDSYWAYSEAEVTINILNDTKGLDLNGDGDKEDFLKEVPEKKLHHFLAIEGIDFEIKGTAIAATKGLTATPSVIRESLVGQEEGSREESIELKIELENALPDDARVRFFVRDEIDIINSDGTSGLSDAQVAFVEDTQKATRGTHYAATVDGLVIPAGSKEGTTTLNLTVFDDGGKNDARVFRIQAQVGSISKYVFIKIADDETPTTNIALSVDPSEIKAGTGDREITITGTLNGDVFEEDQKITLVVVSGTAYDVPAARDDGYTAVLRSLTIPAGETSGSTTVTVTPLAGGDKKVWIGSVKNDPFTKNVEDDDVLVSAVAVVLKDADAAAEVEDPGALKFAVSLASTVYDGMVGTAIEDIELPAATGGEGDRTYSVSNSLPAGLSFDEATRTVLGTPEAATDGAVEVTYTATDSEGATTELTFSITVNPMLDFGDLGALFGAFNGAGKRVPMLAGLNADARMYLDARTAMPNVGEDFVLDVSLADFVAVRGYGLQVQYETDKLEFVEVLTDQPLGGSALAAPQVLSDEAGVLTVVALGDVVSEGEVELSLVFRATTEIENTVVEITDSQTYDSEFGFNRLALPVPVQLQTRPEAFALANNYPNPFNPATTIQYALPQAADVELTVYNVVGQPVRTLVTEHQSAGRYVVEWDETNDSGHSLSSGMYFCRLEAGGEFHEVKKMLLLK